MDLLSVLPTNLYIFALAVVLALLEIQIEGENGWAKELPAWRPKENHWSGKLMQKILDKELTGYHIVLTIFLLLFLHFPIILGAPWGLEQELKILSYYFIYVSVWDFYWFILNPHFPLKHFRAEHIWWHKNWFLGLPVDYLGATLISFLILLPVYFTQTDPYIFSWWLVNIGLFILETLALIGFAVVVLDIDNWHSKH